MTTPKALLKAGLRRVGRWAPHGARPAILMYHRIGHNTFDPWGLSVERDRFAEQIEWLGGNRTVLPLTDFARLHQARKLPRDAISLTFDDGYASVLDAVPLLEKHELHATVFLPTDLIERLHEFWWDELTHIVLNWSNDTLQLEGAIVPVPPPHEQDRRWPPDTPARTPRQKLFLSIWSKLHARTPIGLSAAMRELREQGPATKPSRTDRPLTPKQIGPIRSAAVSFGSHGLNHPSLPALSKEEKLREIADSKARCSALTGGVPAAFAYPFGEWDETSRRLVEQAGYACACATGDAFVSARSNVFALPRLRVGNWEVRRLRDMLGG